MEVARSKEGIVISQRKYILDLFSETGLLGCKPADTSIDPNKKANRSEESSPADKGRYQRLVGRLIYLSHTRPDIAYSVSVVSQHMNNPSEDHLEALNRILRYLKMTPRYGLLFKRSKDWEVEIYTDALGGQLLVIVHMCGGISSLEEAKSKLLSHGVVQNQNIVLLH